MERGSSQLAFYALVLFGMADVAFLNLVLVPRWTGTKKAGLHEVRLQESNTAPQKRRSLIGTHKTNRFTQTIHPSAENAGRGSESNTTQTTTRASTPTQQIKTGTTSSGRTTAGSKPKPPKSSDHLAKKEKSRNQATPSPFPQIRFKLGSWVLGPRAKKAVRTIAQVLAENPDRRIALQGHADKKGSPEYNRALSHKRAAEVGRHLNALGVASKRFEIVALGQDKLPEIGNKPLERVRNRRVEVVWIELRREEK